MNQSLNYSLENFMELKQSNHVQTCSDLNKKEPGLTVVLL